MIGMRVGQYELVEEISKGEMATVYRAYQPGMDRFVAIKVIHKDILADASALQRFSHQARLVAKLEHPHLLPVYDDDAHHDPPYIVMRYVEGATLNDVLAQGALPLQEAAFVIQQITAALDYAHQQGVIHRDIQPSNILIDAEGNAFLTGFGLAHVADQSFTQAGFADYMSPEQALGENIDSRTDIYSLGVVFFQMITGELPYTSDTPMDLVLKHMQEAIPTATERNPALPHEINAVVASAMAKNPDDRYQTGAAMLDALMNVIGDSTAEENAPAQLQIAAQHAINQIKMKRDENRTQIDATMARFAEMREAETLNDQQDPPTLNPATLPLVNPSARRSNHRDQRVMAGGGLLAIMTMILISAILFSGNGDLSNAQATQTQLAFVASVTNNMGTPTAEGYLSLSGPADFTVDRSVADFTLRARVRAENGRFSLYLRDAGNEHLHLDMQVNGDLEIAYVVDGETRSRFTLEHVFTRNQWQALEITLIGKRLVIVLDGRERFDRMLETVPEAGAVRFATGGQDVLWLDDVILTDGGSE